MSVRNRSEKSQSAGSVGSVGSVSITAVLQMKSRYRSDRNIDVGCAERNSGAALAESEYSALGWVRRNYVIGIVSEQVGMLSSVKQKKQWIR